MRQTFITVGTRSATLPVTLVDLKAHLGVVGTTDDTRLTALEWSAVDFIERQLDRCLVTTTITEVSAYFPTVWNQQSNGSIPSWFGLPFYPPLINSPTGFPLDWGRVQRIELSRSPVQSVTSIKYYDSTNVLQTLVAGTDYYTVTPTNRPAFVQPVNVWPYPYYRPDAVQLTYQAGYTTLPGVLVAAIKLLVGAWNENREDFNPNANMVPSIPIGVTALIQSVSTGVYC